jgi:hypothetical protein
MSIFIEKKSTFSKFLVYKNPNNFYHKKSIFLTYWFNPTKKNLQSIQEKYIKMLLMELN